MISCAAAAVQLTVSPQRGPVPTSELLIGFYRQTDVTCVTVRHKMQQRPQRDGGPQVVAGPHESTFDLLDSAGAETQLVSPVSAVRNTTAKSRCRGPERAGWLLMTRPPALIPRLTGVTRPLRWAS